MIMAGEADIVVAGGMENMSMAPYAMTKARFGYRMNNATIIDTMVNDALTDAFNHYHMMITAENVCDKYGITREELDAFSANSQQKCETAIAEGKFDDEIVPVPVKVKKEMVDFVKDEGLVLEQHPNLFLSCVAAQVRKADLLQQVMLPVSTMVQQQSLL